MLRSLYDWLLLAPANLLAGLLVAVLTVIPVAVGSGVGALVYALMERRGHSDGPPRKQYFAVTVAWIAGLYVALVTGVAITRLPILIHRILNSF
jgi:hypothetical protein